MMKYLSGLCLLLAGLATGCQPALPELTETQQAAQLRTRVLALHDSTMLPMAELARERRRLQNAISRLDTASARPHARLSRLRRLRGALMAADTTMTHWMHTYQEPDTARLTQHQYVDFWTTEEQELRALARQMRLALDSAAAVRDR